MKIAKLLKLQYGMRGSKRVNSFVTTKSERPCMLGRL